MAFDSPIPLRLFVLWLLAAPILLAALGGGQLGWLEIAAVNGPLLLWCERWLRPIVLAVAGLSLLVVFGLSFSPIPVAPAMGPLIVAGVFGVGIALAHRARAMLASGGTAGSPAHGPSLDGQTVARFEGMLERELGRARRHERGLALISIDRASWPNAGKRFGHAASPEIALRVQRALRLDSEVVAADDRVLALIPDLDPAASEALLKRLRRVLEEGAPVEVRMGLACFPNDALCAADLIRIADRNRTDASGEMRSVDAPSAHPPSPERARQGAA